MTAARGTTYGLRDAWNKFLEFYGDLWRRLDAGAIFVLFFIAFVIAVLYARKWKVGLVTAIVVLGILGIFASMMLPALSSAKSKLAKRQHIIPSGQPADATFADNAPQTPPPMMPGPPPAFDGPPTMSPAPSEPMREQAAKAAIDERLEKPKSGPVAAYRFGSDNQKRSGAIAGKGERAGEELEALRRPTPGATYGVPIVNGTIAEATKRRRRSRRGPRADRDRSEHGIAVVAGHERPGQRGVRDR